MSILVDKQMYSVQNKSFRKIYKVSLSENDRCKNITGPGSAKWPILNQSERQPLSSHNDEYNY